MKYFFFALVLSTIICHQAHSQIRDEEYALEKKSSKVEAYNVATNTKVSDPQKSIFAREGMVVTIYSADANLVTFQVTGLKIDDPSNTLNGSIQYLDISDNDQFFCISTTDFNNDWTKDFKKPVSGMVNAIVLPLKFRFANDQGGDFEFTQSISLGGAISFAVGSSYISRTFSKDSYSFLVGINASNIPVDMETVPSVVTGKTNALGITPMAGLNIVRKGIAVGFLTGIDVLTGAARKKWVYRNSPWFGISIGTSLLSTK